MEFKHLISYVKEQLGNEKYAYVTSIQRLFDAFVHGR
jgi:hypothetical protein